MFNRVLFHGSEINKLNTTKVTAIKLVQMRLSKISKESPESVTRIVWFIFNDKSLTSSLDIEN